MRGWWGDRRLEELGLSYEVESDWSYVFQWGAEIGCGIRPVYSMLYH